MANKKEDVFRSVFSLNPDQQRAFDKLAKAYKECKDSGIFFVNMYGSLIAYDKSLISDYTDRDMNKNSAHRYVSTECRTVSMNSINIPNEWADDEHFYGMTKKGSKIFDDYDGGEV